VNQLVTTGIILGRTDYGEADRILTLLTPEYGKLRLLAKGVRRIKSKLAGGIELFSVSQLTFIKGRGEIGTVISTRLMTHYRTIVTDLDRTMLGYEFIKQIDKATEEGVEKEFFDLLQQAFEALDNATIPLSVVRLWFRMQLLDLNGRGPNLQTDDSGKKLQAGERYEFNSEHMAFRISDRDGRFTTDHIKVLRIARGYTPPVLAHVHDGQALVKDALELLERV
jgi:DNA repair protein RecO (recombination protein O)